MGDALLVGLTATSYDANQVLTGLYDNFGLCAIDDGGSDGSPAVVTENRCVDAAESSAFNNSGGHALWIPGVAPDLVFYKLGKLVEYSDGTAVLSGEVRSASRTDRGFKVEVRMSGRTDVAPTGSPKLELMSSAYAPSGTVDPSAWYYYTSYTATLTGVGAFEGAVLDVTQRGPAWQLGLGANNKNLEFGGSAWLSFTTVQQPSTGATLPASGEGDFNLSLVCPAPVDDRCVAEAWGDEFSSTGDHALTMPGIATDLMFTTNGDFVRRNNGTAVMRGTVYKIDDPAKSFDVEIELRDPTTTPPPGSPKLELSGGAYFPDGPVDPGTWAFYESFVGKLTGRGAWAGAEVLLTQRGPAWQIGAGAGNKNVEQGMAAWFDYRVLTQPTSGSLQSTGQGDVNVNIYTGACPDGAGGGGGGGGGDGTGDGTGGGDGSGGGGGGGGDGVWCPRTPGYWKNHVDNWNVDSLNLGGTVYNTADLLYFLGYGGGDMSLKLARSLVATKLNLLEGSDPSSIQQSVEDSDDFLRDLPPGSRPNRADKTLAEALKDDLDGYNNNNIGCVGAD